MINSQPNLNALKTEALYDTVISIEGARLQHGPNNSRVYLMELGAADPGRLIAQMKQMAAECGYGKIFAKVPEYRANQFLASGFRVEARIPGFYTDCDAQFLGYYLDRARAEAADLPQLHRVLQLARRNLTSSETTERGITLRACNNDDTPDMAELYRQVFPTYPFAIDSPQFLLDSMADNVEYFCVEHKGRLLALASAEKESGSGTVEMTDFATAPSARGRGFANLLLRHMEQAVAEQGYHLAYTIARAHSIGMNRTFARNRYQMAGRLINNTQIGGQIESMNVWYKTLR